MISSLLLVWFCNLMKTATLINPGIFIAKANIDAEAPSDFM